MKLIVDRLEQYGRRQSVVIRGIPVVEGETTADLTEKAKHTLRTDLPITPEVMNDFDKTHRIGEVFETEEGAQRQGFWGRCLLSPQISRRKVHRLTTPLT